MMTFSDKKSITIEEIKKKKEAAETNLSAALNELLQITGSVPEIETTTTNTFCGLIIGVRIKVTITPAVII